MRIVHISDTHLGRREKGIREREEDVYEAFDEACEKAKGLKPDLVIHSGDIFDTYRPTSYTLRRAIISLRKITDAGIPVVAIAGNHDIGPRFGGGKETPLSLLVEIFGDNFIHLNQSNPVFDAGDLVLCGLQYFPNQEGESLRRAIIERCDGEARRHRAKWRILILHQGVKPFLRDFKTEINKAFLDRTCFNYFALGHYHVRFHKRDDVTGKIFAYPGSLENLEEREVQQNAPKGFFVIDLEENDINTKFVEISSPRPYFLIKREVRRSSDLQLILESLSRRFKEADSRKKPMVRIKLSVRQELLHMIDRFREDVHHEFGDKALKILMEISPVAEDHLVALDEQISLNMEELIAQMFRDRPIEQALALEIYRKYLEGKRGGDLSKAVLSLIQGWMNEDKIR